MAAHSHSLALVSHSELHEAGAAPFATAPSRGSSDAQQQLAVRVTADASTGSVRVFKTGTHKWPNGDVYAGEMVDGSIRSGQGKMSYADGSEYSGGFEADLYHGQGTLKRSPFHQYGVHYRNQSYSGAWAAGHKQGHGVLVVGNGDVYDGAFVNDLFHGHGFMRYGDGRVYTGEWWRGRWHGAGELTLSNGDVYRGGFHDGDYQGEGQYRYHGGGSYYGGWRHGKPHGIGRRMWTSGAEYEGEWQEGVMCGRGIYRSPSGDVAIGSFRDDCVHGDATILYASGDRYQGTLVRGTYCGSGRFSYGGSGSGGGGGYYEGEYLALLRTGLPWREALTDAQRELKEKARQAAYAKRPWQDEDGGDIGKGGENAEEEEGRMHVEATADITKSNITRKKQLKQAPAASASAHRDSSNPALNTHNSSSSSSSNSHSISAANTLKSADPYSVPQHLRVQRITGRVVVGSDKDAKLQKTLRGDATATAAVAPPRLAADGKRHGRGIRVWADGSRYEGEWASDVQHGFGVYVGSGPRGMRYEGSWTDGQRCGQGVASYGDNTGAAFNCPLGYRHAGSDGRCVYDGEWRADAFNGHGTFTCCDGRQHTGTWKGGNPHGPGRRIAMPKSLWIPLPDFRSPLSAAGMTPYAICTAGLGAGVPLDAHSRIRVVEGIWADGVQEGRGRALLNRGDVVEGVWAGGALTGSVAVTFASGRSTTAAYRRGVPQAS